VSAVAYRYVRPLRFDLARCELETCPTGGVALRFERYVRPGGEMVSWVIAARCHPTDDFSRAAARAALDGRARRLLAMPEGRLMIDRGDFGAFQLDNASVEDTVDAVIAWASGPDPRLPTVGDVAWLRRLATTERAEVGAALRQVVATNRGAQTFAEVYAAGLAALGLAERYADLDAASGVVLGGDAASALGRLYAELDAASALEPAEPTPVAEEYAARDAASAVTLGAEPTPVAAAYAAAQAGGEA
jgi:hypothetical protein